MYRVCFAERDYLKAVDKVHELAEEGGWRWDDQGEYYDAGRIAVAFSDDDPCVEIFYEPEDHRGATAAWEVVEALRDWAAGQD